MDKNIQLELRDVVHDYGTGPALRIDCLQIERGKIYALVGPNGSGKTTLLHIMSLLLQPGRGEIFFEGKKIGRDESQRIDARRRMTVVTQNPYMFNATVRSNIDYGMKARGIEKKVREKLVDDVLKQLNLAGFVKRKARHLSGGETQLVALARGLVLNPSILFLDEITANLDAKHVGALEKIIRDINRDRGTTIVLTTHILSQAYTLADQVFSLFEGRIIESGMYNLFKGEFKDDKQELLFDTGKILIHAAPGSEIREKRHISINPEDIIVSKELVQSSARNLFPGKIVSIIQQGGSVHLEVDALETFRVQITQASFHEMGLTLGNHVYLIFKASSVHVL